MIPLIIGVIIFLVIVIIMALVALRILLHYSFYHAPVASTQTPADYGLQFSTHFIPTAHGKKVQTLFIGENNSGPLVIGIHGWENTSDKLLPLARFLVANNYRVVLLNTRNHGASDADGYSTMVKYTEDLNHTCDFYRDLLNEKREFILIGHSLGAATSIYVAAKRIDISAVVAVAAFADMTDMLQSTFRRKHIPGFLAPFIIHYLEKKIGKPLSDLAPKNRIKDLDIPVLIIHGDQDRVVPVTDARTIIANGKNQTKQLWVIKGGNHSSMLTEEVFFQRIVEFDSKNNKGSESNK